MTSCQPAVVYSNGYYYTSFMQQQQHQQGQSNHEAATVNVVTVTPGQCLACSCGQWAATTSACSLQLPQQS